MVSACALITSDPEFYPRPRQVKVLALLMLYGIIDTVEILVGSVTAYECESVIFI